MPVALHTQPHAAPDAGQPAWALAALRAIWARQRGRVNGRIELIERAAAALAYNRLDEDLRLEARRAAHMLAGSLGTFGFLDASSAARRLERELERPAPARSLALSALLVKLRAGIHEPTLPGG